MVHYEYFNKVAVSSRAHQVAEWLIEYYDICDGMGLSRHLRVARQLSNHDAVRVWVQQQMRQRPPVFQTLGDLRCAFTALLPVRDFA